MVVVGILSLFPLTSFAGAPCAQMWAACKAAGYYPHGANVGHGIHKNCLHVLKTSGQGSVPGVNVSQEVINNCKTIEAARKATPPAP